MNHPWRLALLCAFVTGNVGAANLLEVYDRSLHPWICCGNRLLRRSWAFVN